MALERFVSEEEAAVLALDPLPLAGEDLLITRLRLPAFTGVRNVFTFSSVYTSRR